MTLADSQQQRMLERLRAAGDQPTALAELRANGIDFPAAVLSELELNGYAIERVHDHGRLIGVRLLEPQPPDTSPVHPRHDGHGEPAAAHHTAASQRATARAHRPRDSRTPPPAPGRLLKYQATTEPRTDNLV